MQKQYPNLSSAVKETCFLSPNYVGDFETLDEEDLFREHMRELLGDKIHFMQPHPVTTISDIVKIDDFIFRVFGVEMTDTLSIGIPSEGGNYQRIVRILTFPKTKDPPSQLVEILMKDGYRKMSVNEKFFSDLISISYS